MSELKLNNKRTILVGLAFLSICSFWQMYDNLVPARGTVWSGLNLLPSALLVFCVYFNMVDNSPPSAPSGRCTTTWCP